VHDACRVSFMCQALAVVAGAAAARPSSFYDVPATSDRYKGIMDEVSIAVG
jgi:hypothetical protein